ncbi:hypothetical protein HK096_002449 [Nowakowskiella sp. JEL0078]|nr:hypothetical protein HK096_002449 [Nowakowskiella sp. JEL0078]
MSLATFTAPLVGTKLDFARARTLKASHIAYHKEKNAIQITGETQEDVYKAQTALNALFFPVIIKSKRQWARPDRPGQWGQRRDYSNSNSADANNANGNVRLRKMRSESYLQTRQQPQQNGWGGSPGWNSNANDSTTGHGWN